MTYKTGEEPQINDEILGKVDGVAARGRVRAVRENGDVLITRRAPYRGPEKPLAHEGVEFPAAGLSLVYRPLPKAGAAPAPRAAAPKAAKASAAKEAAKK